VTGQGRSAFLGVGITANQVLTRDFSVSHNGLGFYPYEGFRFDGTPAVTSRACNSAISTFSAAPDRVLMIYIMREVIFDSENAC
jgi:hypothetical protein